MKVTYAAAALVAIAGQALAQDLSGLPTCAQTAAISGISSTGCALTDFKCICQSTKFLETVAKEILTACSAADQAQTYKFAANLCSSVGVTISTPGSGPASTSSSEVPPSSTVVSTTSEETSTSSSTVAPSSSVVSTTSKETSTETSTVASTSAVVYYSSSAAATTSLSSLAPTTTLTYSTVTSSVAGIPVNNATHNATGTGSSVPTPTPGESGANAMSVGWTVLLAMAGIAMYAL